MYCCDEVFLSAFSKNDGVQTSKLPLTMQYHYLHLRHLLSGNHSHFRIITRQRHHLDIYKASFHKGLAFDAFKLKPTRPTTETSKALNLCIASFHRWPLFLAQFVPGTALGSQLCVECGNIKLPLQGAYKCLTQTTSKGSLLRKGCQNCQNPKLLGQSLIQEQ